VLAAFGSACAFSRGVLTCLASCSWVLTQEASTQGRFLSPDEFTGGPVDAFSASDPLPPGPLPYADITNPQSLNKYAYTYNNPLKYVDPDGHEGGLSYVRAPDGTWTVRAPDIDLNRAARLFQAHGLDAAGFAPPPVGPVADGLNALRSASEGKLGEAAINLIAIIPVAGDAVKAARMSSKAFATALDGGKHAGFLANYAGRTVGEISSGIESIGKQIAKHEAKLADPAKVVKNWEKLSPKEQQGLIQKWQNDIARQKEQKGILEQLKKLKEQEIK